MTTNTITKQSVQYHVLEDSQCAEIVHSAYRILERTGCAVHNEEARKLLADAGCTVENDRVWIPSALMEKAVQSAPSAITMYNRFGEPAMILEPNRTNFGPAVGCPYFTDQEKNQRRAGTLEDAVNCSLLCEALPNIDWGSPLTTVDCCSDKIEDLYEAKVALENITKPIMYWAINFENCKDIVAMYETVRGGADKLAQKPLGMCLVCPVDPLTHTENGLNQIMYLAKKKVPVLYIPGMQFGCSGPVTGAGLISLGLCDTLVGLLVSQLTQPGAPFIVCKFTDNINMNTISVSHSRPEFMLVNAATADAFRYLQLPFCGNFADSDNGIFDEHAASNTALSLYTSMLSGTNMDFGIGSMECGNSSSIEALVFCDEIVGFLKKLVEGLEISEETLAEDVIDNVGPGGNFLAEAHTAKHVRSFWNPSVHVGRSFAQIKDGAPSETQRIQAKAKDIIAAGNQNPLSDDILKALDDIIVAAEKRLGIVK